MNKTGEDSFLYGAHSSTCITVMSTCVYARVRGSCQETWMEGFGGRGLRVKGSDRPGRIHSSSSRLG